MKPDQDNSELSGDPEEASGSDTDDTQEMESPSSGVEKRIWPYRDERQITKACEQYLSRNTPPRTKRQILDRLLISRELMPIIIPELINHFHLFDMGVRHTFLDLFHDMAKKKEGDLSPIADTLAKYLADPNFGLRQKVSHVMESMGTDGLSATARICGYLRHNLPDVRIAAAHVLAAMGPSCARVALPKLDRQFRAARDEETKQAMEQAIRSLREQAGGDTDETTVVSPQELRRIQATSKTPDESTVLQKYPSLRGKKILIAEDEAPVRRILNTAFRSAGCLVEEAEHGKAALEKVLYAKKDGAPFDAVILDLMMPVMNGGDFLKTVRSVPELKDISVFVISARQERAVIAALAKLSIQGFFPKPYNIASLLDKMDAFFAT